MLEPERVFFTALGAITIVAIAMAVIPTASLASAPLAERIFEPAIGAGGFLPPALDSRPGVGGAQANAAESSKARKASKPIRGSEGACPIRGSAPCVVTLEGPGAPGATAVCSTPEWSSRMKLTLPGRWRDSNEDGSWESVFEIKLDPIRDCGCARFTIVFGDHVAGWTVDVGNSPTNNGHGGDEGTTPNAAEIQIQDRKLSVFSASRSAAHRVDRLLNESLAPLAGRTIALVVCDQAVDVEMLPTLKDPDPPKWRLETLYSKLLFSLGPEGERTGERTTSIYAAFNRVIHHLDGAVVKDRTGSGVRRIEIQLIP